MAKNEGQLLDNELARQRLAERTGKLWYWNNTVFPVKFNEKLSFHQFHHRV